MKDHEIRELVNQLRDIAIKYHGAGQLREQIARTVRAHMLQSSSVCTCPSGDGSLRWPCPVHLSNSPVIPDSSADMLRRWLTFGRGMQNAGCQLPHNLIAETEDMLAASQQPQNALQNIPEIIPGWIPVSERMPETDGNYWGWWSESKRQGPVWFIKSELQAQFQSHEITHWMPLPAAPQEVKGE